MAEQSGQEAGDKPKKRLVKKVETVRELTEKSSAAQQSARRGFVWITLRAVLTPFKLLGRLLSPLGRFKIVRLVGKVLWPAYFRNSWKELRQVTWPTRKETRRLTLAVIIFSAIFGALIAGVDFVLDKVFKQVILK